MATMTNDEVVLAAITAVEDRDVTTLLRLYHPDLEFLWPPGLPYSGTFKGAEIEDMTERFTAVWAPLQPTDAEKRMDPVVVASAGSTVIVHYTWRALDSSGRRFETSTLAHYEVLDGRLAQAQMYYFDMAGMLTFLRDTGVELPDS